VGIRLELRGGQAEREAFRDRLTESLGDEARTCVLLPQPRPGDEQTLYVRLRADSDARPRVEAAVRSLPAELWAVISAWRLDAAPIG